MEGFDPTQLRKIKLAGNVNERVRKVVEKSNILPRKLSLTLGMNHDTIAKILKRNSKPKHELLAIIVIMSPVIFKGKQLSDKWMLRGEGPMFEKE
jgi:hypothetical protein